MEQTFEFKISQLVQALRLYNADAIANPGSYSEITDSEETARAQAEIIIKLLHKIAIDAHDQPPINPTTLAT